MAFADIQARLEHIEDACAWIEQATLGRSLAAYRADRTLRLAVERALEIVSEASRHLPGDLKDGHPQIPWRDVASIGNRLRHGYDALDDAIIWQVATLDLPALRTVVKAMLIELGGEPDG